MTTDQAAEFNKAFIANLDDWEAEEKAARAIALLPENQVPCKGMDFKIKPGDLPYGILCWAGHSEFLRKPSGKNRRILRKWRKKSANFGIGRPTRSMRRGESFCTVRMHIRNRAHFLKLMEDAGVKLLFESDSPMAFYMRCKLRENGFWRHIIPATPVEQAVA